MIAHLLRLALKPLFDWADARCDEMVARALADEATKARAAAILDAAACPDEIEPPAEYDAQELVTEIVIDAANERLWERGWDDFGAWEDDRIPGYVEGRQR